MAPNSALYVFSDGIYDFLTDDEVAWGLDAFCKLLATDPACRRSLDDIVKSARQQNRERAFNDDLSLMRVRFFDRQDLS